MSKALDYAKGLIAARSITPATGEVFDVMEAMLRPLGFDVHRFKRGDGEAGSDEEEVENLFAIRRGPEGSTHFAFAGHLDVVPPGDGWESDPFKPEERGELLYGRGAVDMKGSIASMIAAVEHVPQDAGTISFIITGDEEGPALHGTRALIDYMAAEGIQPDLCLVGEPTSVHQLGDMMKIGRRGSVNIWLEVDGTQGHVAYPHLADNPMPKMVAILAELDALVLDEGTDWFQPSNLEITEFNVANKAHNVIPAKATARISIRFNDTHSGASLSEQVTAIAEKHGGTARPVISGEPFLTAPGAFSDMLAKAIEDETGMAPEPSTTGGTSDARFLRSVCPVIEFGLCNATMHKRDEAVAMPDLDTLARIYTKAALGALALKP
ncbi:succinyl-diaminopimelate desuccinylase [Erythrobacter crassostreae]|uniref:Succinyl-diaminopimelate desuccinylase n=1 Tax=Erythrobacter crassostreae TaxID=2828328 RepID=A0A9X1F0S0_9SPHN|nr:succinyl-diaminopimelate desuccinylase [Erythrobacter crassostrea]MBV7258222.1 succinyl-diaminopimelate desuccinylase [Erythrobacter crassostrea]